MSSIFQRPLCEMGKAYDFAYRPAVGEPDPGTGGPCDDHPHPVWLIAAEAPGGSREPVARSFLLCPEHEAQLRRHDARVPAGSRFRPLGPPGPGRVEERR